MEVFNYLCYYLDNVPISMLIFNYIVYIKLIENHFVSLMISKFDYYIYHYKKGEGKCLIAKVVQINWLNRVFVN